MSVPGGGESASCREAFAVDYARFVVAFDGAGFATLAEYVAEELPYVWLDAYLRLTSRPANALRVALGSFVYLFDDYASLEATGAVPRDTTSEGRLIAAFGISSPQASARDDYRLKGWVGPTERNFGKLWDKGHYIGHSLGGAVDRWEINVFVQRRDLNRGWSAAGKRYRDMEAYCA